MSKNIRLIENLHVPLWLIKDTCWMLQWKIVGISFIAPTLGFAIFIAWEARKRKLVFYPSLAIVFWIMANSIWMIDEFFELGIRHFSLYSFIVGFVCVFFYGFEFIKQRYFQSKSLDSLDF